MTNESIIETLSTLPQPLLEEIRLNVNIARNANPLAPKLNKRQEEIVNLCNKALEFKDAQRLSGMDTIDIDCQFV